MAAADAPLDQPKTPDPSGSRNMRAGRRRRRRKPMSPLQREIVSYIMLFVGCVFVALGFNLFLLPNKIASGGVAGISIIVHEVFGIAPAYTQWALNIPLFVAGVLLLGRTFGIKTAIGTTVLPLFILLTSWLEAPVQNPFLGSLYGGLVVGIGLGIIFRGGASTGGTTILGQILHRKLGISIGTAMAIIDGSIIVAAGILISLENALYALIGLYVTSKTIDVVQTGLQTSKAAFIISNEPDKVSQAILHDLDRGLTRLEGKGGYTGQHRPVLLVVLGQNEVAKLKALVRDADPNAFVIISDTAEVLGEGFQDDPLHK